MNPIGAAILSVICALVYFAPRRWAMIGTMLGVFYLTYSQNLMIGGFNIFPYRVIETVGFVRVMVRKEFSFRALNKIDWVMIVLQVFTTLVFVARSNRDQFNQIGTALDWLLCYFMFRGLLGGFDDFTLFLRDLVFLLLPFTVLVLVESITNYNVFIALLGKGFVTASAAWFRGGRIRCWGSFRNPSLLGTPGAIFIPLYIALALDRAHRKAALFGLLLCGLIVYAANSGGPINCAAAGVAGWFFWKFRKKMRLVRIALVIGIAALAMSMKAPIWYLPAKASSLTGGDGYHRSYLMDVAMRNINMWWVNGLSIEQTATWFPYELEATGGADITNQFLSFAINAGIAAMALFIFLLVKAYAQLGKAMARLRSFDSPEVRQAQFLLWGLGAALLAHIFNWFGITYFDQTNVLWLMQLAAIANLTDQILKPLPEESADETAESTTAAEAEDIAPHAV